MKKWIIIIALLVITAAALYFIFDKDGKPEITSAEAVTQELGGEQKPITAYKLGDPSDDLSVEIIQTLATEQAETIQLKAYKEIELQVGSAEYRGAIEKRPHFVSPIEWYVIETKANQTEQPAEMRINLVNKLRFYKLKQLWQESFTESDKADYQQVLAEQLLEGMPNRVADRHIGQDRAFKVIEDIVYKTYGNSEQSRQRVKQEAARIGVSYDAIALQN